MKKKPHRQPALQNITPRTELGEALRKAFLPEPGKTLIDVDFKDIEAQFGKEKPDEKEN